MSASPALVSLSSSLRVDLLPGELSPEPSPRSHAWWGRFRGCPVAGLCCRELAWLRCHSWGGTAKSAPGSDLCPWGALWVLPTQSPAGRGVGSRVQPPPPPAQKPRVSENHFEDLLSNQGFSSKADKKGPRTIAEMRRQDQARDTDPLKLKVRGGGRSGPGHPGRPAGVAVSWALRLSGATGHLALAAWAAAAGPARTFARVCGTPPIQALALESFCNGRKAGARPWEAEAEALRSRVTRRLAPREF